jgi:hypothetical protein
LAYFGRQLLAYDQIE